MIIYRTGSLFEAPVGALIAHACNTRGRWASGVAAEFAHRYPLQKTEYEKICRRTRGLLGKSVILEGSQHPIGCLFTSDGYGDEVDPPEKILQSTKAAVADLLNSWQGPIHIPKINSGLFRVPWSDTAEVLETFNAEFVVWTP
jgi:ADP-ribose 1''-phosphate phosphatase